MMLFTFGLVLLFILRLRFPQRTPISTIIRQRYGGLVLRKFRDYEKSDLKVKKQQCDLEFLIHCHTQGLTPKFVHFKLYRKELRNTRLYRDFQKQVLKNEIETKRKLLKKNEVLLSNKLEDLKSSVSWLDSVHLVNFVNQTNNNNVHNIRAIHRRKLINLGFDCEFEKLEPDKLIFNLSSRVLTNAEKEALSFGLKFAFPPKKLDFYQYFLSFEKTVKSLVDYPLYGDEGSSDVFKSSLKHFALTYYYSFDHFKCQDSRLTHYVKTLKNLAKDKSIIVLHPDKGNGIVLVDRINYVNKIEEIISDTSKFRPMNTDTLKMIFKLEDKLNRFLRTLKDQNVIDDTSYNNMLASGSQPGIMYGLPKVHKDGCPFRPILSAIGTHSYNLAKFLVSALNSITSNEYSLKDSFQFVNEVTTIKNANDYVMASFDVTSLFTNIPLDETIDIALRLLFPNENDSYMNFDKKQFKMILDLAVKDNFFLFNDKLYSQIDGVAMGSPLGPTLANIFMSYYERIWLDECPIEFKPTLYRRYVDDTFLLFRKEEHISKFLEYLNSKHRNIKFTVEKESDSRLSFLDVSVCRVNNIFETNVFRKKTYTGLGMNFSSSIPITYKRSLIGCLVSRAYTICSNYKHLTEELDYLRRYFLSNGFPLRFIESCFRNSLNKIFIDKEPISLASPKIMYLKLPFYGTYSYVMKRKLSQLFRKYYPEISLRVIMTNTNTIGKLFQFKDRLPDILCSRIVYKYSCGDCGATYVGKSQRHLHTRIAEHKGLSIRTGQPLAKPSFSNIRNHAWQCNHRIVKDNFKIITRSENNQDLHILESLAINQHKPNLNDYNNPGTLMFL